MTLQKSKKILFMGVAAAMAMTFAISTASAGIVGTWKRGGGNTVKIWKCGGGLCAKTTGTLMFNGIKKAGKNSWKGDMKHHTFPGTYNGTVTYQGKSVYVEGCMFGSSGCASETWTK